MNVARRELLVACWDLPHHLFSIKRWGLRTLKKFVCSTKFVKGTAILVSKAYLTGRFVFDDSKRKALFF